MYGITLARSGASQTVQFGLRAAYPFGDLEEVFWLISEDIAEQRTQLQAGTVDGAWGRLRLRAEASLELRLTQDGADFLLFVSDAETGSETTTGAKSLAEALAFCAYWAGESFE